MMVLVVGQVSQVLMELMDQREMMVTKVILVLVVLKENVLTLMDDPALEGKWENQDIRCCITSTTFKHLIIIIIGCYRVQRSSWS